MTTSGPTPDTGDVAERRAGELNARELVRWVWRQVTSMRTALILLLLLALAAVPGSVIPQSGVDALEVSQWKSDHPDLAPIYEKLGLFSVYDSPWFAAIYLLLMISLVGCIVPRTAVYARALRAAPPRAPRNLARMPAYVTFTTDEDVETVLATARQVLRTGRGPAGTRTWSRLGNRHRLRAADPDEPDAVSAERGHLREFGNLVFHVSVIVVLIGVAVGSMLGYQGGVLLVKGQTFTNTAASYDDLDPGSMFGADDFDPFAFTVDDFDVTWLTKGNAAGTARQFRAPISYQEGRDGERRTYDLRVNHPLTIGNTDIFLIGHGYAPVITIRDGNGDVVVSRPVVFLPQDPSFLSFGVVKAPSARPGQIGLDGLFFPTFQLIDGDPVTVWPDDLNPLISMSVWTGDLGLDDGTPESVYLLNTAKATPVAPTDGRPLRIDLQPGETVQLPDGLGSVSFDGIEPWVRVQISQSPGKLVALGGMIAALLGLLGSLFVRSRRVWVRARPSSADGAGATMVEIAVLDRSGGSDVSDVLNRITVALGGPARVEETND